MLEDRETVSRQLLKKSLYDSQNISSLYWSGLIIFTSQLSEYGTDTTVGLIEEWGIHCILSQHLFHLCTDSVIREAKIEELWIKTDGK